MSLSTINYISSNVRNNPRRYDTYNRDALSFTLPAVTLNSFVYQTLSNAIPGWNIDVAGVYIANKAGGINIDTTQYNQALFLNSLSAVIVSENIDLEPGNYVVNCKIAGRGNARGGCNGVIQLSLDGGNTYNTIISFTPTYSGTGIRSPFVTYTSSSFTIQYKQYVKLKIYGVTFAINSNSGTAITDIEFILS